MPPPPIQPPLFPQDRPAATQRAADPSQANRPNGPDASRVYNTLCILQAPTGITRLSEMMDAGSLRTQRGSRFHPPELRPIIDVLIASGHVARDFQGRLTSKQPHAQARLRAILLDAELASAWFDAWRKFTNFDKAYSMGFQDSAQLAATLRLVLYGGRTLKAFERLRALTEGAPQLWSEALRAAVLQPFDAQLFDVMEPALQTALAETLLTMLSGFPEASLTPLEDWLLARHAERLSPTLRGRLVETLLFRGDLVAAESICATLSGGRAQMLHAALSIARGEWQVGATAFQAALKQLGNDTGRRQNLVSPSVGWLYLMALLAQPDPADWTRARKFAQSESGKREAHPYGFWGAWQVAIDQRLGDAPKSPAAFALGPLPEASGQLPTMQALQALHHLLLAAWLRLRPTKPALLQPHAERIATDFETARMGWLAQLTRPAAAALLSVPPTPAHAELPFFVLPAQDGWRDAPASILALGAPPSDARPAADGGVAGRLIWVVTPGADGRITVIEPMEQKAGPRGLSKPKPISLGGVLKRNDLPAHDAGVLRAMLREEIGNRPVLDLAAAASALVGHPHVAWFSDPLRFIKVTEALPGLEVMTQDEHIAFRLLDPLRTPGVQAEEAQDALLPQRWRQQRVRLRNTLLLAEGDRHARLIRLSPAQSRVAELVAQGWKVPVAARTELDAALRVLAAHFRVASDANAGHDVAPDARLRAELTPHGPGLSLRLLSAPFGDFGPRLPPGEGRARVTTVHQGATLSTQRELAAEVVARERLLDAADVLGDEGHGWLLDDAEQALATVEALEGLGSQIFTEWPKGKPTRVRPVADAAVQVQARSKGDWLELDGTL